MYKVPHKENSINLVMLMVGAIIGVIYAYTLEKSINFYGGMLFWTIFCVTTIVGSCIPNNRAIQIFIGCSTGACILFIFLFFARSNGDIDIGLFRYSLFLWPIYGTLLGFISGIISILIREFLD